MTSLPHAARLEQVTNEILNIPDVTGIIIFSLSQDILYKKFTIALQHDHLEKFIGEISDLTRMSDLIKTSYTSLECGFKNLTVVSFKIDNTRLFSVFFQKNANKRVIKLMVLNHLDYIRNTFVLAHSQITAEKFHMPELLGMKGQVNEKVKIKPSLRPRLDIIQNALNIALNDEEGSTSYAVMGEAIQKWATLGPVNKKELPVLADILSKKINEATRKEKFLEDIEDTFLGIRR